MPAAAERRNQDREELWSEIRNGVNDCYNHEGINAARYLNLYSLVYNFLADGHKYEISGARNRARCTAGSQAPSTITGVRLQLLERIRALVSEHLTTLAQVGSTNHGENLVAFYKREWDRFTFSTKVMNGFCSYFNRHIPVERDGDNTGASRTPLLQSMLVLWKDEFFTPLAAQLITPAMQVIKRDREGDQVNVGLVKGLVDNLMDLEGSGQPLDYSLYRQHFEDVLILETENFYAQEAQEFLQSTGQNVSAFMKKVEQRLWEEVRRADLFLPPMSKTRLLTCCENVLISRQLPMLYEAFPGMMRVEHLEDLGRMYDLVSRLGNSFGDMMQLIEDYITAEGKAVMNAGADMNNGPEKFIKAILDVHQKFQTWIVKAFKQDPGFVAALDRAFSRFINDADANGDNSTSRKIPEMLARHCDLLLKNTKAKYNDQEMEQMLSDALVVFKFVGDKDVFQVCYRHLLANRLVLNTSTSEDTELFMIIKLKTACGYEYTYKLQKMHHDINLSKDMNTRYRSWASHRNGPDTIDFTVITLTSGCWPFSPESENFALPAELQPCVQNFEAFYQEIHMGRKLSWLKKKSKGELVSNCFPKKYTFILPTYHMAVLLQFNDRDSYKVKELMDATLLTESVTVQVVQMLVKVGIVKITTSNDGLTSDAEVTLNKTFVSEKLRIQLTAPLKTEKKLEEAKAKASVDFDRNRLTQCAIVRIMKQRKELSHQDLISEVIGQLSSKFQPSVPLIKKCIDELINLEHLEKKPNATGIYLYVA